MIDDARFPGRQGRLLFAYLAAEQGRAVPRDELAEALWGDAPPATWEKALSVLVSKLRTVFANGDVDWAIALTGAFGCYRLDLPKGSWVDVLVATSAGQEAESALAGGDLERAKESARLSASLLRLPFLPGDEGAWVEAKQRELSEVRARALTVLADAYLRAGEARESVRWAEQAIEVAPFRESGYRRLMEAHVASGNRGEALQVYERCRHLLAEELGAYPSPETQSLYRGLLEGPSVASAGAATAPATPPSAAEPSADLEVPETTERGGPRAGHRRHAAIVATVVLVVGAVAAALALTSRGGSPPKVLPNSVVRIDPKTLRPTQVVRVGDAPDLVVAAGGFVWVTNHVLRDTDSRALRNAGDRTLTRVDPSTGDAVVVGGGLAPCGLAADPSGDVWVANCYPPSTGPRDDVVRIDARTLDFKRMLPVPGGDGFYRGLAFGGGSIWVGQISFGNMATENVVTEVDPQTGARHTFHLTLPGSDLAWSEGYGDLWIDNWQGGSLMRLHAATRAVTTIDNVAVNPTFPVVDGNVVWVGDWSAPQIVRLRAVGSVDRRAVTLPVDNPAVGIWTVAAGAGAVWAAMPHGHTLWRIDPRTDAVTRVPIPYLPTGVAAGANDVWVTVRGK